MFAELWRITSFRLTALYGSLFALAVAGLLALIYWQTAHYQNQQTDQILQSQAHAFSTATADQLDRDIAYEIERDVRHISYFGVFSPDGHILIGNLSQLPYGMVIDGKPHALLTRENEALISPQMPQIRALGRRLTNGNILIVARDVALLEQIRQSLLRGCYLIATVILSLGIVGGIFYSLPAVRHIRKIDRTVQRIAAGDYSQRLPIGKRNHELNALVSISNAMLDDTERLMGEVKTASDNIAHDLRTPLTRLRASIYRTRQSMGPGFSHHAALDHALTQTDLLLTRFRALSRISEIESCHRRAGFSLTPLGLILRKLDDLYTPLANQGKIRLTLSIVTDANVFCDGELLFEAIGNLIDNAIKFTPPNGLIEVTLESVEKSTVISVSDSGPGIAPDQRKAVLQRFYRTDEARNIVGSGLGLSLVDAIMRLHGFGFVLDDGPAGGARARIFC
jgi:signal transduction histidine kinase